MPNLNKFSLPKIGNIPFLMPYFKLQALRELCSPISSTITVAAQTLKELANAVKMINYQV